MKNLNLEKGAVGLDSGKYIDSHLATVTIKMRYIVKIKTRDSKGYL